MPCIIEPKVGEENCKALKCERCPLTKYCDKKFSTPNDHFNELCKRYENEMKKIEILNLDLTCVKFLADKTDIQKELEAMTPVDRHYLNLQGYVGPDTPEYLKHLSDSFEAFIAEHSKDEEKKVGFVQYLYQLMDKYGYDNPANLYNSANISRQLWSSIISEKSHPSLNVCIKIAFAMQLTNHECKYLLKKAGYTLASSSKYALIIRFALEYGHYNLDYVNQLLEENGYGDQLIY